MRTHVQRRWQIRGTSVLLGAVWLALVLHAFGCGIPKVQREPKLAALAEKLDTVETVQLADQSRSKPVTIEEATRTLTAEVAGPNEPRQAVQLSLDQVRAAALANNLDLRIQLIEPAIAQQSVDAERARFESVFFGSGRYTRSDLDDGGAFSSRSYEAGVSTPLHTGGEIIASLPMTNAGGVTEAAASVSVVQSLLRGAGTRVNLYSIQIAGYQRDSVDAFTKLQAIYILGGADIAYWQLYAAHKQLAVSREQYKMAQNQLKYARDKVAAGSAAKIEIVYAEAGLSSRLDAVISNETTVRDFERDLKRIMNRADMPLSSPIDINTVTDPDPRGLDLDPEVLVEAALRNRMELAELEFRLAIGDIDIALARNNLLPLLTLEYAYAAGGQAGDVGGAFEDVVRRPLNDHQVGLSGSIPLGNRAAEARLRRARLGKIQDEVSRDRQEQRIRQEVYEAVDSLEQGWRRILAAEQGVITAERNYQVEQLQFQLGRTTSTEVLRAASSLAEAQSRKIQSLAAYEIAQVLLARATGTLLGRSQIRLQPTVLEGK